MPGMDELSELRDGMADAILSGFGVPAHLPDGTQTGYAPSEAARLAFERQLQSHKVGLEFALNVMLDPLLEEGWRALEEYRARQRRLERTRHERN